MREVAARAGGELKTWGRLSRKEWTLLARCCQFRPGVLRKIINATAAGLLAASLLMLARCMLCRKRHYALQQRLEHR